MYTSYIGKKYLTLYNEQHATAYDAKTFFDKIIFPLFFDDERHLMHVGNSAFFQKPPKSKLGDGVSINEARLAKLHDDIANSQPNMAIMVGSGAKDMMGTTSGQLSNIDANIDSHEMYASWFGQALGIGVSGGYVMLVNHPAILNILGEGWKYYRQYLSQTHKVKGRQIETWNGQWLRHVLSHEFDKDFPLDGFEVEVAAVQGNISIPTIPWVQVIFLLNKLLGKSADSTVVYAYNLSQTNTTFGFLNVYLSEVRRLWETKQRLLISQENSILNDKELEELEPFFNFRSACQLGTIGLKALEPKDLRKYMPKGTAMYAQGKPFKFNDQSTFKTYQLLKIWIVAMLNKTELSTLAADFAKALKQYEQDQTAASGRGKKGSSQLVKDILDAKHLRLFIDKMTGIMVPENATLLKETLLQVLTIPSDNFPLFLTLVRFEYNYLEAQL